ncbi:porin family protein [Winogradskyella sp.]|nr:porin family protein [Winogradskyella sp.]
MKNKSIIFLYILVIAGLTVQAQESKFYIGLGAGYASIGGDLRDNPFQGGLNINFLNAGYRINETWGVTANIGAAGHPIDNSDSAIGISALSFGPMISVPVSNMTLDIKPQYIARMVGVFRGDEASELLLENLDLFGSGFVLGNSLVMNSSQGFTWSIDADYLSGKFNKATYDGEPYDEDLTYNSFRIGLGVRYNF